MALSITNNIASLNAQNNLNRTNTNLSKSLERLSTGLKINRGADGPAGLVISEQQRAQIAGLKTAIDNSNKAVSLVQTAEGALNELNTLLTKVRGLALDSANSGVNETSALAANQSEITNALATINNIANTTKFGSAKFLLNGQAGIVGTATVNPSSLGQINAGAAAPTGAQTVAVGALGGGSTNAANLTAVVAYVPSAAGGAAGANPILGGTVTGAAAADADANNVLATDTLTVSGGGLTSAITVNLTAAIATVGARADATAAEANATTTVIGVLQTSLDTQAGANRFLVTGSTTGIVVTAIQSNQAVTVASNSATAALGTGFATGAGTAGTTGGGTVTVTGGGLRTGGLVVDVSAVTGTAAATAAQVSANLQSTLQTALDAEVGTGNFVVAVDSANKISITSKLSNTAVNLQSQNATAAAVLGIGTTVAAGTTASGVLTSTTVANGNATGARTLGAANTSTGTLSQAGTLTLGGGGLTSSLVVNLNAGDGASAIATKVQQALDGATALGGGAGKFTVSATAGTGKLTIQSNIIGSAAITVKADSATTTAVTGVTNTGSGDTGAAGNALAVFVGSAQATISTGSQGLGNAVTFGGSEGLSFNVGVSGGKVTGGTNSVSVTDNSLSFQIGANAGEFSKISINKTTADRLGTGVSGLSNLATTDLGRIDVTTASGAQDAIKVIDQAITDVSNIRAKLGAFQTNSLESNANSLRNTLENTQSAESVIRDTDFASEIANFTRLQTQLQAGSTVLGNANQQSALIAQLLRG